MILIKSWTRLLATAFACINTAAAGDTPDARFSATDDSALAWRSAAGRMIKIRSPQMTVKTPDGQSGVPLEVKLKDQTIGKNSAVLEYVCSLDEPSRISGSMVVNVNLLPEKGDDGLIVKTMLAFENAVTSDAEVVFAFDVAGDPATRMGLPERNGFFRIWPMSAQGGAGRFELGQAAKGPLACSELGMPVVALIFDGKEETGIDSVNQLAVSADPYCGSYIHAQARTDAGAPPVTQVSVRTTYSGSVVPLTNENRTFALEFHNKGIDRTLHTYYHTIPEIQPAAAWTHGIHLVYYDYLSEQGEGWFKDLKTLADMIPMEHRGHVALCMHGWYDYFQQYAYDHEKGRLLDEWTAFPGTFKVKMSLAEMHRRIKFAKDLGFRVLLYFADGTNSDSGAPNFREEYVLKAKDGRTFAGWKGPDSLGSPLKMDPSVPGLRDWFRGYLKALLAEYAEAVDGFVWDETFYIDTNFISYPGGSAAYADRAMMSLVSELTQITQEYRKQNPDLVFLASDIAYTNYALVANGTFQDSAMEEKHWGPSMFTNYRNCLWSCNWYPLRNAAENQIAAEKYGLPQGVSNGWGDSCGPNRMPPELLKAVVDRFTRNVESNRQRVRFLLPDQPPLPQTRNEP